MSRQRLPDRRRSSRCSSFTAYANTASLSRIADGGVAEVYADQQKKFLQKEPGVVPDVSGKHAEYSDE